MKIHVFLGCMLALMTLPALSQNYKPGYLVLANGDTLKGEVKINEKRPLEPYVKVTFRETSGVQKTHKPIKTLAYGFEGQHFLSFRHHDEPGFYRVLSKGAITLLEFKYEGLRMNKPYIETEYYIVADGKNLEEVKEKNFKKQLNSLMSDNPEAAAAYEQDKFDPEAAAALFNEYNAGKGGENKQ